MSQVLEDDELRELLQTGKLYSIDGKPITQADLFDDDEPEEEEAQPKPEQVLLEAALDTLKQVVASIPAQRSPEPQTVQPNITVKPARVNIEGLSETIALLEKILAARLDVADILARRIERLSIPAPTVTVEVPPAPAPTSPRDWKFIVTRDTHSGLISEIEAHAITKNT